MYLDVYPWSLVLVRIFKNVLVTYHIDDEPKQGIGPIRMWWQIRPHRNITYNLVFIQKTVCQNDVVVILFGVCRLQFYFCYQANMLHLLKFVCVFFHCGWLNYLLMYTNKNTCSAITKVPESGVLCGNSVWCGGGSPKSAMWMWSSTTPNNYILRLSYRR